MFTSTLDGAGQLPGYFSRFGEVAAHRASQCIYQDTFHLMDGLGGQIVIVKVTHKGTEHLGCPVHCSSSRTLISLTTPVLRKYRVHSSRHRLFKSIFMVQSAKDRTAYHTLMCWKPVSAGLQRSRQVRRWLRNLRLQRRMRTPLVVMLYPCLGCAS